MHQRYFNTSHVTVYQLQSALLPALLPISIHLMLLFIKASDPKQAFADHFNTSHVTVYLRCWQRLELNDKNFNTSHVTVYQLTGFSGSILLTFQYISCYCLSQRYSDGRISNTDFNTSHVTVYRSGVRADLRCITISIHLMLLFI